MCPSFSSDYTPSSGSFPPLLTLQSWVRVWSPPVHEGRGVKTGNTILLCTSEVAMGAIGLFSCCQSLSPPTKSCVRGCLMSGKFFFYDTHDHQTPMCLFSVDPWGSRRGPGGTSRPHHLRDRSKCRRSERRRSDRPSPGLSPVVPTASRPVLECND